MTDHDQNAIDALCSIVTPVQEFRELGLLLDRSAVQSRTDAVAILDAIRAGKVPGINSQATTDAVCNSLRNHLVVKHNNEIAALRAELDAAKAELAAYKAMSTTEHAVALTDRCNALMSERDAALARMKDAQTERELLASRLQDLLSDRGSNAPQSMASLSAYLELAHQERDKAKADNDRLRRLLGRIVNTQHSPTCFRLKPDPACQRCEAVRDAFKELG